MKKKIVFVTIPILLCIAIVSFIMFSPKTIRKDITLKNDQNKVIEAKLDIKYHRRLTKSYYTGNITVNGITYTSGYDIYREKDCGGMFFIKGKFGLEAWDKILTYNYWDDENFQGSMIHLPDDDSTYWEYTP